MVMKCLKKAGCFVVGEKKREGTCPLWEETNCDCFTHVPRPLPPPKAPPDQNETETIPHKRRTFKTLREFLHYVISIAPTTETVLFQYLSIPKFR